MIVNFIDFLKERLQTVKTCCYIAIGIILVWTVTGVDTHHAHTWMETHIPWFWSIFGVLCCLVLVYFARWFGRSGIMTREDYYDN
jgi:cytochrome bd-type quinol oxidase subunit 2